METDGGVEKAGLIRRLVGYSGLAGVLVGLLAVPIVGTAGVSVRDSSDWLMSEPLDIGDLSTPQRSKILAADGSEIATFYQQNRVDVKLKDVAGTVKQAVLAIEDSRFYEHGALDAKGTLRALMANLNNSEEPTQGGSGITQQYVKNLLYMNAESEAAKEEATEVTKGRKLRELRYAIAMERRLTKDEILQGYLNVAYYGDGAYGIEAAAQHFFDRTAKKLTLGQAATLAGVLKNGNLYNPTRNGEGALNRRNIVLDRMAELGMITPDVAVKEKAKRLVLDVQKEPNGCTTSKAAFFCDYVQREILTNPIFGKTPQERDRMLWRTGLTIRTTLDWRTQNAAAKALRRHVPEKNSEGKAAAEVLIRPGTGEILGMDVDRKLGDDRERGKTWINFAADADHGTSIGMPAGSTFKAFTLAAAFEDGIPIGERIVAPGGFTPIGFRTCSGKSADDPGAVLKNSADGEGGRSFSLLTGSWHSVNTFFLKLEKRVGLCETMKMAKKLGIRTKASGKPLVEGASFTLGANEVSPLRVAAAYAAFGARGKYCEPIAIKSIVRADGKSIPVPKAGCEQVMDEGAADAVSHVLRGVLTQGTGAQIYPKLGRPVAGKTGTVDDFAAAWFAGYTPDLAAAVWVGDPRGGWLHKMQNICLPHFCGGTVFGASIPGPIWAETMRDALSGVPATPFHRPPTEFFRKGSGEDEVRLPDLRGLKVEDAIAKLRALQIGYRVDPTRVYDDKYKDGEVAATDPAPGSLIDPGDTELVIVLTVSKGKDPAHGDDGDDHGDDHGPGNGNGPFGTN
ncbi:transglycosylase domain-containing protein [Actinocorallia lasiicapitis]